VPDPRPKGVGAPAPTPRHSQWLKNFGDTTLARVGSCLVVLWYDHRFRRSPGVFPNMDFAIAWGFPKKLHSK